MDMNEGIWSSYNRLAVADGMLDDSPKPIPTVPNFLPTLFHTVHTVRTLYCENLDYSNGVIAT